MVDGICFLLKHTQQALGLMPMVSMESTCRPTSSHARDNPLSPHNQATTTNAAAPIAPLIPTPAPRLTFPTAPPVEAAPLAVAVLDPDDVAVAVLDPDNAAVAELTALPNRLVADPTTLSKLLSALPAAPVAWLFALPALLAKELAALAILLAAAVASETATPATEAMEDPAARALEAAAVAPDTAAEAREVTDAMTPPTEFRKELTSICGKASGLALALAFGFAKLKGRRIATKATVAMFVVRMLTIVCSLETCRIDCCYYGGLKFEVGRRKSRRRNEWRW